MKNLFSLGCGVLGFFCCCQRKYVFCLLSDFSPRYSAISFLLHHISLRIGFLIQLYSPYYVSCDFPRQYNKMFYFDMFCPNSCYFSTAPKERLVLGPWVSLQFWPLKNSFAFSVSFTRLAESNPDYHLSEKQSYSWHISGA